MRPFFKNVTLIALVALSCSGCVLMYLAEHGFPQNKEVYRDANWKLVAWPGGCSLYADRISPPTDPEFWDLEITTSSRSRSGVLVSISLAGPHEPKKTGLVLVDLGMGFTRHIAFAPLGEHIAYANFFSKEELGAIKAALLQSPGEKSVTFDNGTRWQFPPTSPDLVLKMAECWRNAGL